MNRVLSLCLIAFLPCVALASVAPLPTEAETIFQPGFHQSLRWSWSTPGRTTFRLKVPVLREGRRLRIALKAGDGPLRLHAATVALAGTGGALASPAVPITFGGSPTFTAAARERKLSDPVTLPVGFNAELAVSFDVDGALAVSSINAFPESFTYGPGHAADAQPPGGTPWFRAIGLETVDVEGPRTRAFVAIGDSITEGYVEGDTFGAGNRTDDYRNCWSAATGRALRLPVANAAVSGQGVDDVLQALPTEVFPLENISDCLLLIGTNDVRDLTAEQLESRYKALVNQLAPFCRVWAGTLPPRERASSGDLATMISRSLAVNAWLRQQTFTGGLIDFERVTAQPGDPTHFLPGYGEDGIHPTVTGQRAMGVEAARVLGPPAAGGDRLWSGNFSTGDFSQWTKVQAASPDRMQLLQPPIPHENNLYAVKVTVKQGDLAAAGNRSQLVRVKYEPEGSESYYRWSTLFASDYPSVSDPQIFLSFNRGDEAGPPPIQLRTVGEEMQLVFTPSQQVVWRTPLVRGTWHRFIVHVKFSNDPAQGFVELIYDGATALPKTYGQTVANDYLKLGLNRGGDIAQPSVAYYDGMVQGRTLESVLPSYVVPSTASSGTVR